MFGIRLLAAAGLEWVTAACFAVNHAGLSLRR